MNLNREIIKSVCLTEKATLLGEFEPAKYVFRVEPKANKLEIKRAVETNFNVKVTSVNTCNYHGKKKRERRPDFGRRPSWKKAIVTLAEGETLELV
jgi:large subunit ribosomal protein L23